MESWRRSGSDPEVLSRRRPLVRKLEGCCRRASKQLCDVVCFPGRRSRHQWSRRPAPSRAVLVVRGAEGWIPL